MAPEPNSLSLYLALFLGVFSGGILAWALLLATPTFLERRRLRIKESILKIEKEQLVLDEELKRFRDAEVALTRKNGPPDTAQQSLAPESEKAIDKERLRIAHELHDDIVQRIAAVRLRMEEFSYRLDHPELVDRLSALSEEMNQIMKSLRFIIYGLPQPQFENTFSILMKDFLLARLNRVASKTVEFNLENEQGEFFLPLPAKRELYNLVQEAVQNSLKHSTGFRLKLSVCWSQMLEIEVTDNGQGYLPQVGAVPGLGFASMQTRAEAIGARVHVIPSSYGVVVKITLPNLSK
jgi:signal transduction histidine kinase